MGVLKYVCLKLTTTARIFLSYLRSSTCSLADDPEASVALDPRLNIGLRKLAKRIQDFVKAVTPQSQQTNSAFHLNKETKSRQSRASSVTSRSNDKAGDSLSNTWHQQRQSWRFLQQHVASATTKLEFPSATGGISNDKAGDSLSNTWHQQRQSWRFPQQHVASENLT